MTINDIQRVWISESAVWLELKDGRQVSEKFSAYPRLATASDAQRHQYVLSPVGIHWPDIDEDLSYKGFLRG